MYCVGIDLGTTNTAVAFSNGGSVQLFRIPQLNAHGVVESLSTLPSFLYLKENGHIVGEWAREEGSKVPTALIQSAKSWLSNPAANRKEKILPFEADKGKLSPVEASACYLRHIREAWNRKFETPLEEQEVILTVPASFDEVARALTVEAAHIAGISRLTLLEEPQAAFYNWLMENEKKLDILREGESILVVDVGGGTTDFSLIEVTASGGFQRMAVGKHLLLGGDNMDAALCHYVEKEELDQTQWLALKHQARAAKEAILGGQERFSVWIPGRGSQVVGGGKGVELTKEGVESILVEGFFGLYSFDEARRLAQGSGIRKMGLPYEREPSITKHLATFLSKQAKPTYLLFNGGTLKAASFQSRLVESINTWFPEGEGVKTLASSSLDLAVARGAAYFGKVRKGEGVRISGGTPRSYYLGIDKDRVVTLLPRGAEEGCELTSEHTYALLPNTPVSFQLYHSHTRLGDQVGTLLPFKEEEMTPLPPIQTVLRFGAHQKERIPVKLTIRLTEIGTVEMWLVPQLKSFHPSSCSETGHKWRLEFQLEAYSKEKRLEDETFDTTLVEKATQVIVEAFAIGSQERLKTLMSTLEEVIDLPRVEWRPSLLRGLFESLLLQAEKRSFAESYASRFWNMAGFLLRPGRGYPLDDFRVKQLWKLILADAKRPASDEVEIQKMICFRRIASGLTKGQQMHLFSELSPKKSKRRGDYAYAEQVRALASLELIDVSLKMKLGEELVSRITSGKGVPCDFWAIGRLGARELLNGTAVNVIPPRICEEWIERLMKIFDKELVFPLTLMGRQTDCREINLSPPTRERVRLYLENYGEAAALEQPLTLQNQEKSYGDSLPSGLTLR